MNRLMSLLFLILVSPLAYAQYGFLSDDVPATQLRSAKSPVLKPVKIENDNDEEKPSVKSGAGFLRPSTTPVLKPKSVAKHSDDEDDDDEEETESKFCKNCVLKPRAAGYIHAGVRVVANPNAMQSPIWASFARSFQACAPGCQPASVGVWRDPYARPKPSCHHNGQAIDIGAMICDGQTYRASRESRTGVGPFSDMVRCMKRSMKTIYRAADHWDHAHFSNGCQTSRGTMY